MKIGVIITSFGPIDQYIYHNHISVLLQWNKEFDIVCYHLGDNQQESSLNAMSELALADKCDYLLYLEHDNLYPKTMLSDLIKHNVDIVSGYYTFRNWPFAPIPLKKDEENGLIYRYEYSKGDPNKPNLMEMTIACFGCCLVKAEVVAELFSKNLIFRREYDKKSRSSLTVDVVFFRDCIDNKRKIYVDGHVRCGHLANRIVINPDNYEIFREMTRMLTPNVIPVEERLTAEEYQERKDVLLKDLKKLPTCVG